MRGLRQLMYVCSIKRITIPVLDDGDTLPHSPGSAHEYEMAL